MQLPLILDMLFGKESPDSLRRENTTLHRTVEATGKELEKLRASHDVLEEMSLSQASVIADMDKDTAEYLRQYSDLKASHTTQSEVITELSAAHTALLEEMSALRVERDRLKERRGRVIQLDELEVRDILIDDCLKLLNEIDITTKVRGGKEHKAMLLEQRATLTGRWEAVKGNIS